MTDTLISLGYYVSSIGFLIASLVTFNAMRKSSQSGLKTVLTYLFIGTGTFFFITIFQKMAASGVYSISDESPDIWWHLMFYMAMFSYYIGFKKLAGLASADASTPVAANAGKTWGIISAVLLVIIFIIPNYAESWVNMYTSSRLGELGLHHFIAFIFAGIVGAYVFSAKIFLGQIGRAIASPMIIAVWAVALQHLWELLNESWKVIIVTPQVGEGVEKIFLTIAAICVIFAALRLKAFAKA
ncbi:MAG: hypothetical protein V4486_01635 [Patescibacteria group bacterium]